MNIGSGPAGRLGTSTDQAVVSSCLVASDVVCSCFCFPPGGCPAARWVPRTVFASFPPGLVGFRGGALVLWFCLFFGARTPKDHSCLKWTFGVRGASRVVCLANSCKWMHYVLHCISVKVLSRCFIAVLPGGCHEVHRGMVRVD